ncbi:hypothetical protein [Jeotgalibacillus marinus]|uniref:EAL domain-containing protein n=1 Tax=Jeotgalibacillus marinus TaxID=86667 RepID=A0ABV3PYQ1_9BACL
MKRFPIIIELFLPKYFLYDNLLTELILNIDSMGFTVILVKEITSNALNYVTNVMKLAHETIYFGRR